MKPADGLLFLSVRHAPPAGPWTWGSPEGRRLQRPPFGGHNNDMNQGLPADG